MPMRIEPVVGRGEADDAIEKRGLASARGSEHNGETRRGREIDVKDEFGVIVMTLPEVCVQRRRVGNRVAGGRGDRIGHCSGLLRIARHGQIRLRLQDCDSNRSGSKKAALT